MTEERVTVDSTDEECDEELQQNWYNEAEAVIADVKRFVTSIGFSTKLQSNEESVYLNLETKESNKYCVELSARGFRICGNSFDSIEKRGDTEYFETMYALLDTVSVEYRRSFSDSLIDKLNKLENKE